MARCKGCGQVETAGDFCAKCKDKAMRKDQSRHKPRMPAKRSGLRRGRRRG